MTDELFTPIFVPVALREAVSDRAWLQAMLDAEVALARAEAAAGVIPAGAAEAISACCDAGRFEIASFAERARRIGSPVEPLVRALAEAAGDAGRYVHWGATSQDIVDTAAMLVARDALDLILGDVDAVAACCASLAETYRSTPIAGRTLMQQALPTTFGLKAAGWLVGVVEARSRLAAVREERLAVQLGGGAGTLAALGEQGPAVLARFAEELDLAEPALPWHANRARIAELAAALDLTAGALSKLALDVVLLSQTEVAEVAESGAGGSSTMPHKRNPTGSILAIACARRVHAQASLLTGGLAQEHERAAGGWHAEWQPLSDALALTGGAAAAMHEVMHGLEVNPERMRANLDATGGLIMAERITYLLAVRIGRTAAHELVSKASARAVAAGRPLRAELEADPRVELSPPELDAAFDPTGYLGSAEAFVDRALDLYRQRGGMR
ncbi:MAG TPA: 3-carboxy-cis,cis-muconate cycloisomerase [Gaiellaceae bacterium]|nr:3-carboxy-cis,cis-muconate cycloisomerase [Gaiellaceae bacterium]